MGPFSLTGQPNAMGGREVGGLANQLAAHMGFTPAEIDRVRRFWNAPRMATREGLKAVQMFEAIERGEIKALWVMATNPAVSLPRAGAVRAALEQARAVRRVRERALERHRQCRRACAAAGGGLGREGRHGHQFRAPHLAPARVPAAARRSQARLVDRVARWRGAWVSPRPSPIARRPTCSASTRRCRRSRTTARAISISAASRRSRTTPTTRSRRCNGRCARRTAGESRFFADGGFFTPDRKARFVAPEPPALREATVGRLPVPPQHRPHPRPVAHHDAHRPEPAARPRICRSRSSRSIRTTPTAAGLTDGGFAHVVDAARRLRAQGRRQRRPAAGLAVRADPLERRDRLLRARRRSRVAAHRSLFRPAGSEGDAGRDRAGRASAARLRADAPRRSRCRTEPGGRASRSPAGSEYRLATNHGPMVWHDFAYRALAGDAELAEQLDGAASIAPPPSSTASSTAACSSGRPTRRSHGTRPRCVAQPTRGRRTAGGAHLDRCRSARPGR